MSKMSLTRALGFSLMTATLASAGACGGDDEPTAVIKFCNPLANLDGTDIDLTLEVGQNPVKVTATSGQCAPRKGASCLTIPTGTSVPLKVALGTEAIAISLAKIEAGEQWIVAPDLNDMTMEISIRGRKLEANKRCADEDPFADGGMMGGTMPPMGTSPTPRI